MKYVLPLVCIACLLIFPFACGRSGPGSSGGKTPLVVYCAAGLRTPVEKIKAEYEAAYGTPLDISYEGSQSLLAKIELAKASNPAKGDVFIAADESFVDFGRKRDLISEVFPVASMNPVLGVRKGNPKHIGTTADLTRDDIRIVVAEPKQAAIGSLTEQALSGDGVWDKLYRKAVTHTATVNEAAMAVKLGSADAAFIWDQQLTDYPDLERVDLPELKGRSSQVQAAIIKYSRQPTAALHFARYLAARDRGLPLFAASGFQVVDGDVWAEKPTIRLFSGAMLRPAITDTLAAFEAREGVKIDTIYNGCGILVGQMKAGAKPDAYFACDTSFMDQVADMYFPSSVVSSNYIIMIVPKGNPKNIKTLQDLMRPGLRVGLGDEEKSALGALTKNVLVDGGVYGKFKPVMTSATGDLLINSLQTGALDVTLAYVSNAARILDKVDTIAIDQPAARATQPVAIGKNSQQKYLMGRLVAALTSADSKTRFEKEGFGWKYVAPNAATATAPGRP